MLSASRGILFTIGLSLFLAHKGLAFGGVDPTFAFNTGCRHAKKHECDVVRKQKCKKTVTISKFQTWKNICVTGKGTIFQQVANITQGKKIQLPDIHFSSCTTEIEFPEPKIELNACEGDTIFITAVIVLEPNSSIISKCHPLIVETSDTKEIIVPRNVVLIPANTLQNNTSNTEIIYINNAFRTIFQSSTD